MYKYIDLPVEICEECRGGLLYLGGKALQSATC